MAATAEPGDYGWVDIDNYGNFYNLTRLMLANGHRRIAFINGDEDFTYALFRHRGVMDAIADGGLRKDTMKVFNSLHPMGDAGYKLTHMALADPKVTAIIYSSTLMAVEGHAAIVRSDPARKIAVATMDDELHYIDLTPLRRPVHYRALVAARRRSGADRRVGPPVQ